MRLPSRSWPNGCSPTKPELIADIAFARALKPRTGAVSVVAQRLTFAKCPAKGTYSPRDGYVEDRGANPIGLWNDAFKPFQMISNPLGRSFPVRDCLLGLPHARDLESSSF